MTSGTAFSGLLASNVGMLAATYTTSIETAKRLEGTITLHHHYVTAAYLCFDKSIRHGFAATFNNIADKS